MTSLHFAARFEGLTGHPPFLWQRRLFDMFASSEIPVALDIPTGIGKTSVIAVWYIALKSGADVPRRLAYVVDRRAVVDQATTVADDIKQRSNDGTLQVSTLRGQHVDNRAWLEDPAAPAIVVGTVDMIGSRLLFSGYGVSRRMRPFHAGLLGADTLAVLDESHLVPPFERLLEQISGHEDLGPKGERERQIIPRFHVLPLSATGRERDGDGFRLTDEEREDPIVRQRLRATKQLTLTSAGGKKLADALAAEAWERADNGHSRARVLVYCNSRDGAESIKKAIEGLARKAKVGVETELFVGARRVREREIAKQRLKQLGFFSGDCAPECAAFVVATSAGEVGVDLDADHMVMDLAPFERMVQRLGRVNRLGGDHRKARIIAVREHEEQPQPKKPDAPTPDEHRAIIAWQALKLLQQLPRHEDGSHDASPGALGDLRSRVGEEAVEAASSPLPLYPALTRPLVEAWSMTSLKEHTGRPEVQPWLRGWTEEKAQTTLVWRTYLPVRDRGSRAVPREIGDYFAAVRPHLAEMLQTETFRVLNWLLARAKLLEGSLKEEVRGEVSAAAGPAALSEHSVVCMVVGGTREETRSYTLANLLAADKDKKDKRAIDNVLNGATLVLDARLGGLTDGLLDAKADIASVSAADGEDGWLQSETGKPLVPFRVRRVSVEEKVDGSPGGGGSNWQPVHAFDAERDGDDQPLVQFVVEKWRGEATNEDARSIAWRAQSLDDHQRWTGDRATTTVEALGLREEIADAIVLAARLHDEGKKAARWQNAFRTPSDGRPFAKSATRRPPDFDVLGGYRHEFGSISYVEKRNEFGALPDDLKDLVLHLVAAHHGRARPVIATDGCDDGPPSLLEARARDVALRFARLQKRFGPWGLAWLEALLRAADQRASRDLEVRRPADG